MGNYDVCVTIDDTTITKAIILEEGIEPAFTGSFLLSDLEIHAIAEEDGFPALRFGGSKGIPQISIVFRGTMLSDFAAKNETLKPVWSSIEKKEAIAAISEADSTASEPSPSDTIAIAEKEKREKDSILLYTDGSCRDGIGSWVYVAVKNGEKIAEASGLCENTTSTRMELLAVANGLKALERRRFDGKLIIVRSDYLPLVSRMRSKRRNISGMLKSIRNSVTNSGEMRKIEKALKAITQPLEWEWVKGHSGERWNTYCDKVAGGIVDKAYARMQQEKNATETDPEAILPAIPEDAAIALQD